MTNPGSDAASPQSTPPRSPPATASAADDTLLRYGIYLKMILLLFVVAFAALALAMIEGTVRERSQRQARVASEIGAAWGYPQRLVGPILVVPYTYRVAVDVPGGEGRVRQDARSGLLYLLPDTLNIETVLDPEERYRGIFRTVVYKAGLKLGGIFTPPDLKTLGLAPDDVQWDKAALVVGISDLRGIDGEPRVNWDGNAFVFRPGVAGDVVGTGINAGVPLAADANRPIPFTIELKTLGSRDWSVAPLGKTTNASFASPWRHPSFSGAYLPVDRSIRADGFSARWTVSYLGRDFPQAWKSHETPGSTAPRSMAQRIGAAAFGVSLVSPVDFYLQSERAVKHGILIVVMVLAAIFIFEYVAGVRFHLVQYGLVSSALCVFFLLLLSFAEITGFALAYGLAALLSTALIAWYAGRAMRSGWRGWTIAALLAGVYGFLFVVLQLEDLSLVAGALGLFAALAAAMIATRNVDWYALRRAKG